MLNGKINKKLKLKLKGINILLNTEFEESSDSDILSENLNIY